MVVVRNLAILILTVGAAAGAGTITARLIANVMANPVGTNSTAANNTPLPCTNCGGDSTGGWVSSPIPPGGCPLINGCSQNFSAGTGLVAAQPAPPNPGQCFNTQMDQAVNAYRASQGLPQIPFPQAGAVGTPLQLQLNNIGQQRISDMLLNNVIGTIDTHGNDIATQLATNQIPVKTAALLEYQGCLGNPPDFRSVMNAWLSNPDAVAVLGNPKWTTMSFTWAIGPPFNNPPPSAPQGRYFVFAVIFAQ